MSRELTDPLYCIRIARIWYMVTNHQMCYQGQIIIGVALLLARGGGREGGGAYFCIFSFAMICAKLQPNPWKMTVSCAELHCSYIVLHKLQQTHSNFTTILNKLRHFVMILCISVFFPLYYVSDSEVSRCMLFIGACSVQTLRKT